MTDTTAERIWQAQLDRLRAELAVPACPGNCRNCPLSKEKTATHGAVSSVSFLTSAEAGPVT